MNFVLKNADFSSVSISTKKILDSDAERYIQATGSSKETAINNFVVSLKTNNLYDKFSSILIPANGASSFNKAFVNLKDLSVLEESGSDSDIVSGYGYNLENATKSIKLEGNCNSNSLHVLVGITDYAVSNEQKQAFHIFIDNDYAYKGISLGTIYYKNISTLCSLNWSKATAN